jgi:hypothetical protein
MGHSRKVKKEEKMSQKKRDMSHFIENPSSRALEKVYTVLGLEKIYSSSYATFHS